MSSLKNLTISKSPLTGNYYIGYLNKNGTWKEKRDITDIIINIIKNKNNKNEKMGLAK